MSMMVPQPAMFNAASRQLWNLWSAHGNVKGRNLVLFHLSICSNIPSYCLCHMQFVSSNPQATTQHGNKNSVLLIIST